MSREHLVDLGVVRADVARMEIIVVLELVQRDHGQREESVGRDYLDAATLAS